MDLLINKIDLHLYTYRINNRQQYQDSCHSAVQLIFNRIGWTQFNNNLFQITNSQVISNNDEINTKLSEILKEFITFELSDEYNQLNEKLRKEYEEAKKNINSQFSQMKNQFDDVLAQMLVQQTNTFSKRHESKQELCISLQKQVLDDEQKSQEQNKKFLTEQVGQLKSHIITLFTPSYLYIDIFSVKLMDRIKFDFDTIPSIQNIFSSDSMDTFGLRLLEIKPEESFVVLIKASDFLVGCYYPSSLLKREDMLFGCSLQKNEFLPLFDETYRYERNLQIYTETQEVSQYEIDKKTKKRVVLYITDPKLKKFEEVVTRIIIASGKLELNKQKLEKNCFFSKDPIRYDQMSLIMIKK